MARLSDPKKLALWRGRFRRFLDSGLAVARFCAVEHVSESSFYYWQKKLGPQALRRLAHANDRDAFANNRNTRAGSHNTCAENYNTRAENYNTRAENYNTRAGNRDTRAKDRDTRAGNHNTCAGNRAIRAENRAVFRPVTVAPGTCGVVVRLPGGTRIEVDADALDAIRAVVAETVRVDHGRAAGRNVTSDNRIASCDNRVIGKRGGGVPC